MAFSQVELMVNNDFAKLNAFSMISFIASMFLLLSLIRLTLTFCFTTYYSLAFKNISQNYFNLLDSRLVV